tara:strand:- start:462 stop:1349 length:888 start_codon:yes stop_codon:yes gene_type:complete
MLVQFAILFFNSCGETEIAEETNPYKGVKTKKVSHYNFLKEKLGESVYEKEPYLVEILRLNVDGEVIEIVYYDSTGKELDINKYGTNGRQIKKYDESGRLHIIERNYLSGKQYERWEYDYTEFDSIKSIINTDENNDLKEKLENLFDSDNRKIEINKYDIDNNLRSKEKIYYQGKSKYPNKIVAYNKEGDETEQTEIEYTWFDIDSVNIKTRLEINSIENFNSEQVYIYNKSGKKVESNFSYHLDDSEDSTTVVSSANYDSTGKMVSFFNKAAFDSDELKPTEKLIFEYEYYDEH